MDKQDAASAKTLVILLLSLFLNQYLIWKIYTNNSNSSNDGNDNDTCLAETRGPTPERLPIMRQVNGNLDDAPKFTGMLSHLIIELDESPENLLALNRTFTYWTRYPPCLVDSVPTNWSFSQVTLTVLMRRMPGKDFAKDTQILFQSLPAGVKSCFKSFEVRQANLPKDPDARQVDRNMFSTLVTNRIGLDKPSYVMYTSPSCVPVQPNWLNLIDYRTRPPNEPFWMLGSLPKALTVPQVNRTFAAYSHLARHSIYNIGDDAFAKWYVKSVGHYTRNIAVPRYAWGGWEMDIFHYLADLAASWDYQLAAKFRPTNVIWNAWNTSIVPEAIIAKDPEVAMACGIPIDLLPQ